MIPEALMPRRELTMARFPLLVAALLTTSVAAARDPANFYIHLHAHASVDDALVYASDVAELSTNNPRLYEAFSRIRLFATPSAGDRRRLTRQELAELLTFRGLDPRRIFVEGAAVCMVSSAAEADNQLLVVEGPSSAAADNEQALEGLIRAQLGDQDEWQIELIALLGSTPDDRPMKLLTPVDSGPQIQTLRVRLADGEVRPCRIRVTRTTIIPVLRRDIPRGERVHESDLVMQRVAGVDPQDDAVEASDLIGMEATSPLQAGRPVRATDVRKPLVVHRRQIAEVVVRRGGVSVQTTARPLEDGAIGDVVTMQSLDSRDDTYFAVVIGPNRLEVVGGESLASRRRIGSQPSSPLAAIR